MDAQGKRALLQKTFGRVVVARGDFLKPAYDVVSETGWERNRQPTFRRQTESGYVARFANRNIRVSLLGSGGCVPEGHGKSEAQALSSLFKTLQSFDVRAGGKTYRWNKKARGFRAVLDGN